MTQLEYRLWSTWLDYHATGEGRTMMAWIGYATGPKQARERFASVFDEYFARACEAQQGVVRNDLTRYLWSDAALEFIEGCDRRGSIEAHSYVHFNFT